MRQSLRQRFAKGDDLIRSAGLAFLLRAFGAGLAFAFNVAIGRLLGAEGAGLYFLALSVVSIGAVVTKLGLDSVILRFVAAGVATDDWGQVRSVFVIGLRAAGALSFIVSLGVFLAAPWLATAVFSEPAMLEPLRFISFAMFAFAMMTLLAEALKGLQYIGSSMLVSGIIYPVVGLIAIYPLSLWKESAGAALAYLAGTSVAALVGLYLWYRALAGRDGPRSLTHKTLIASARPLWLMSLINQAALPWLPLFLLGIWGSPAESGVFGAATRVAMVVTLLLSSVNAVIAPRFAALHAQNKHDQIARTGRLFTLIVTVAASPVLLVMIFAGDEIMGLFGPDFRIGGTALAILAIGQAVNAMTGSVGYLLIMTGHEKDMRTASILAVATLIAVAIFTMPHNSLLGAATANAAAIIVNNVFATIMVKIRLNIIILPLGNLRR